MVRKTKRTSAPAPRVQALSTPSAPGDQPVPSPAMFGPASWCPPLAPQGMAPSSAPWLAGLQHHDMAGSSAQSPWWAPSGIGAAVNHAPTVDNLEDSNSQAWGVLNKNISSPAQVVSNGTSLQPITIGDDTNDGDCTRTEKRLLWTKEEDLRLFLAGWKWYAVLTWSCVLATQMGEEEEDEEEEGRRQKITATAVTVRGIAAIGTDECK